MSNVNENTGSSDSKSRIQLRLDPEVHNRLKELSRDADISVNKLLEGLARWAAGAGRVGEPVFMPDNRETFFRPTSGVVWFGDEAGEYEVEDEEGQRSMEYMGPYVAFWLDYREKYMTPPIGARKPTIKPADRTDAH